MTKTQTKALNAIIAADKQAREIDRSAIVARLIRQGTEVTEQAIAAEIEADAEEARHRTALKYNPRTIRALHRRGTLGVEYRRVIRHTGRWGLGGRQITQWDLVAVSLAA